MALWDKFSAEVREHIATYTAAQYGDSYTTLNSVKQCMDAIHKYWLRHDNNARGETEQVRDLLKVAHYAQIAHFLLTQEKDDAK